MGDLSAKLLLFKEKVMIESQLIKSNPRVLKKQVETCGAPALHLIMAALFD
jgi:hypothetical protein